MASNRRKPVTAKAGQALLLPHTQEVLIAHLNQTMTKAVRLALVEFRTILTKGSSTGPEPTLGQSSHGRQLARIANKSCRTKASLTTEAPMSEATAWLSRPLEPMYPVVFFDALQMRLLAQGQVRNQPIYWALGLLPDGTRDIAGVWIQTTEGVRFWPKVFNDLQTRGVRDMLVVVTDSLQGMPEALGVAYPATTLQTGIVQLIRNSLDYASWKDRKALAKAIRPLYTAPNAHSAEVELAHFEQGLFGQKFPTVAPAWRDAWDQIIPFFNLPSAIRRVIYTTNAIDSIHARLRKAIKAHGYFLTDEAAIQLIWLALRDITTDSGRPARDWKAAMNQFAVIYGNRFTRTWQ